MADPKNKVFIITGAAKGLGKGFAGALLKEGAYVSISDVLDDIGQETVEKFSETFGKDRVFYCHCDVTKQEEFENLWDETEKYFGKPVDVLVNNAGINHKFGWRKCMDIDIMGVMIGTFLAFDRMGQKGSGRGGHVINTASVAGLVPSVAAETTSYFVAKAGVVQLTESLGQKETFEKENIRIACLCPSFTDTNIINVHDDLMEKLRQQGISGKNLMTVDKVVDAFMQLFKENRNGAALAVMPRVPPFYWPSYNKSKLYFFTFGSGLLSQAMGFHTMKPQHQIIFVLLVLFVLYLAMKFLICLFF